MDYNGTPTDHIAIVSLNHKSFSIHSLANFAITEDVLRALTDELSQEPSIHEIAGLRTCNRVEFVVSTPDPDEALDRIHQALARVYGGSAEYLREHSMCARDTGAVRHLFRLIAGLESMVIGDAQIFGQVKQSYQYAVERGHVKKNLHTLFQKAFAAAKEVRSQTGLGKGRISISALAVECAAARLDLTRSRALVVGAGKMGSLAARYLRDAGAREIVIVNRTPGKCAALARETGAEVMGLCDLETALAGADVVISSTASTEPVITRAMMERAAAAAPKPRLLIDITLPADIEPEAGGAAGAELVTLDQLREVAEANQSKRLGELRRAEEIIEDNLNRMGVWPMVLQIDSIANNLGAYAETVCEEEIAQLLEMLPGLTPEQRALIGAKMNRLAERIILAPRRVLRKSNASKVCPSTMQCLEDLFRRECETRAAAGSNKN